jgi:hypothetical protein
MTSRTLAERMGRLYERHLYKSIVKQLRSAGLPSAGLGSGQVSLKDVRFKPGGSELDGDVEAYNAARKQHETKLTKLVLNATTLNSGRDWRFSSTEVGDPLLGYIRFEEIDTLKRYREKLAARSIEELHQCVDRPPDRFEPRSVAAAILWKLWEQAERAGRFDFPAYLRERGFHEKLDVSPWPVLQALVHQDFPTRRLMECELGELRAAKQEAWRVVRGPRQTPPAGDGLTRRDRERRFWRAIREIGGDLSKACRAEVAKAPEFLEALMDFVVDLYRLRSSCNIAEDAKQDFAGITLGDAVAASACFPPVFPPYTILGLYDDTHVATLRLTDGGVFDNQGIATLFEEECTHIIASDAGGTLELERRVTAGRFGMMGRILSILMDNVRGLELRRLREDRRVTAGIAHAAGQGDHWDDLKQRYALHRVAFFHMSTPPEDGARDGLPPHPDAEEIAHIRTDLDAFGDAEIAAIVYQGYALADRFVRRYLAETPFASDGWQPATQAPLPRMTLAECPERKIRKNWESRVMRAAAWRSFRSLKLWVPSAWILTVLAVGTGIYASWRVQVSLGDVGRLIGGFLAHFWPWPQEQPVPLAMVIGVLTLAVLAVVLWRKLVARLQDVRTFVTIIKWARAFAGNLLWPLGLLPLWLSLFGSLIAGISHFVYNRVFLRATRCFDPCEDESQVGR